MVERLPLSVWPTAQHTSRAQRTGRYLPESVAHPATMLRAIARHAVTAYTAPGDVVLDPMCGIGTTLVEAVHLGRDAIRMEYEPRWASLARRNLNHAGTQGATGRARVLTGDSRGLPNLLGRDRRGEVALVLTSPPYGPSVHGQVAARPGGVAKRDYRYSRDRANLAHVRPDELLDAFDTILTACVPLLRPDGIVAVTTRSWRQRGALIDPPAAVTEVAHCAGLVLFERNVALLAALRDDRLVPRSSCFQLDRVRRARHGGIPRRVIAHEDVPSLSSGGAGECRQRPRSPGPPRGRWRQQLGAQPAPAGGAPAHVRRDDRTRQAASARRPRRSADPLPTRPHRRRRRAALTSSPRRGLLAQPPAGRKPPRASHQDQTTPLALGQPAHGAERLRVATLTRISTDEVNQPYSVEAQANGLEQFVASQPAMTITHRFVDQASGATLDRPTPAGARRGPHRRVRRAARLPHRPAHPLHRRAHDHRGRARSRRRRPHVGHRAHRHPRPRRTHAAAAARHLRRVRTQPAHRPQSRPRRMARRPRPPPATTWTPTARP